LDSNFKNHVNYGVQCISSKNGINYAVMHTFIALVAVYLYYFLEFFSVCFIFLCFMLMCCLIGVIIHGGSE